MAFSELQPELIKNSLRLDGGVIVQKCSAVAEWTQILGLVLMTKKLVEWGSQESTKAKN